MQTNRIKTGACALLFAAFFCSAGGVSAAQVGGNDGQVAGVLRTTGDTGLQALLERLQAGFVRKHPAVQFANHLKGDAAAIYGLEQRTADLAMMSRPIHPFERYGTYERSWIYPVEIELATGSARSAKHSGAHVIVVHKDNPLTGVTLDQLDRIFGAQRQGGWKGLVWDESVARKPQDVLRTWGQLGVNGTLAQAPINTYGPPLAGAGVVNDFQEKVMHGGASWNESYREYAASAAMLAALARDPQGIAYTTQDQIGSAPVKVLAVAANASGKFVLPDDKQVADRRYPLHRSVYLYYTVDTPSGDPGQADPKVLAFVRYVLGPEGQAIVAKSGTHFALDAATLEQQKQRANDTTWPTERPRP